MLCIVFPNVAISQTIYDQNLRPQFEEIEATPEVLAQADILYNVQKAKTGFCSCVTFVKRLTGYVESVGKAKNWPKNSIFPQVGGAVITNESPAGHVAYIKAIVGNTMTLAEANYVPCEKSERKMVIDDPRILGFWINN